MLLVFWNLQGFPRYPQVTSSVRGFVTCAYHRNAENVTLQVIGYDGSSFAVEFMRVAHASTWMQLYYAAIWIEVQRLTQKMPRDSMVSVMPSDGWSSWRKVGRYARSWPASRSDLKTRIRPGSSEGHVS